MQTSAMQALWHLLYLFYSKQAQPRIMIQWLLPSTSWNILYNAVSLSRLEFFIKIWQKKVLWRSLRYMLDFQMYWKLFFLVFYRINIHVAVIEIHTSNCANVLKWNDESRRYIGIYDWREGNDKKKMIFCYKKSCTWKNNYQLCKRKREEWF